MLRGQIHFYIKVKKKTLYATICLLSISNGFRGSRWHIMTRMSCALSAGSDRWMDWCVCEWWLTPVLSIVWARQKQALRLSEPWWRTKDEEGGHFTLTLSLKVKYEHQHILPSAVSSCLMAHTSCGFFFFLICLISTQTNGSRVLQNLSCLVRGVQRPDTA